MLNFISLQTELIIQLFSDFRIKLNQYLTILMRSIHLSIYLYITEMSENYNYTAYDLDIIKIGYFHVERSHNLLY